ISTGSMDSGSTLRGVRNDVENPAKTSAAWPAVPAAARAPWRARRRAVRVDLDQRDGAAARRFATNVESGDINAGLAQGRREAADEARLVEIGDVDHRWPELGVHADALDVDDARPAVGEYGPRHRARQVLHRDRDRDETFVIALGLTRNLLDHDAPLLCHDRR